MTTTGWDMVLRLGKRLLFHMSIGGLLSLIIAWLLAFFLLPLTSSPSLPRPLSGSPGVVYLIDRVTDYVPVDVVEGAQVRKFGNQFCAKLEVEMNLRRNKTPVTWAGAELLEAGFPLRAFWCERVLVYATQSSQSVVPITNEAWRGGIAIIARNQPIVLPWWPKWLGVLGNAAIYTGAVLLARVIINNMKQLRRKHSGRCIECGYQLKGTDRGVGLTRCPECGHSRSDWDS